MLQFELSADVRNTYGKCAARSMRREGLTPAVLYGPKTEAMALSLHAKSLTKTLVSLQKRNAVFNLKVNDGSTSSERYAIVKEIQAEPITGDLVHTDFLEVKLDEPMTFDVPVHYIGAAKGVDLGGEMHIALSSVKLKGLILDIPDSVELNVSDLGIGDKLHCSDLTIPAGVEMLNELEATCAAVVSHAKAAEGEGGEEGEAAAAPAAAGETAEA
jgi:large subunit ribosomal protein L25